MIGSIVSIGTRNAIPRWNATGMNHPKTIAILMISAFIGTCVSWSAPQERRPKQPATARQTTLSGCIDEQDGRYILIHEQTRDLIANLEAEGFPTEGFAKHLGHKVTVRGAAASDGPHPVFKVRSIKTVNEHCGPQQH